MDEIKKRVRANAMRELERHGLSEREWCRVSGYPYGGWRSIVSGRSSGINSSTIIELADALGITPAELLEEI